MPTDTETKISVSENHFLDKVFFAQPKKFSLKMIFDSFSKNIIFFFIKILQQVSIVSASSAFLFLIV